MRMMMVVEVAFLKKLEESWRINIKIGKGNQGGEAFKYENMLVILELFSLWGILNELSFSKSCNSYKE